MTIQFNKARWSRDSDGLWIAFLVKAPHDALQFIQTMQAKLYDADIKIHRERRSLEANSYLWILCQKIAEAVGNLTKEDVYRETVKAAGKFDFVLIADEAAETFIHNWNGRGLGWIADRTDYQRNGFTQIICYYGSSVYDSKSMSALLEYVVDQAKELDIETRTPDEIAKMEALWNQ